MWGTMPFYKALIQIAGAFVHTQKHFYQPQHSVHSRRLAPAARLLDRALYWLEAEPAQISGLDLEMVRTLCKKYQDELIKGRYEINPWSPEQRPMLKLFHNEP